MGAFWVGFFLCWFFFRFVFCLLSFFFFIFFFFPFFLFFLFLVLFFHTKIDHSLSSESENRPPSVQNYKSQRRAVGRGPSSAMAGRGGNGGTHKAPSVRLSVPTQPLQWEHSAGRLWGRWELTAHTEQSQVAEGPQQHPSIPSPRRQKDRL